MTEDREQTRKEGHAAVDKAIDAGMELMILRIPPAFPDEYKPMLALHLLEEIAHFEVPA